MPEAQDAFPYVSERDLVAGLAAFGAEQDPLETTLRTDARVIARVTDGIYRQPGSALRELISNAYDADATRVTIRTDRPRFSRMVIDDNGIGMSPTALVHLLHHIGGSAKRTTTGAELGLARSNDPMLSPGGRPLIGKIGIGLFSVAQLTQSFQIITKVAGDNKRSIASVILRQYSDEVLTQADGDAQYEAGRVLVWREPATDIESQGTSIVLDSIRPQTRDTLRSKAMWDAVYGQSGGTDLPAGVVKPPRYHIGTVEPADEDLLRGEGNSYYQLPWSASDDPHQAFRRLVDSVWDAYQHGVPNPRLEKLFDYYLTMVWQLSLWAPLPYIDVHPFDLLGADHIDFFTLPSRERAERLTVRPSEQVRTAAGLGEVISSPVGFAVTVDDLELQRPIRMRNLPATSGAVQTPLLFVAAERETFEGIAPELSGGPLAFQAYLLWAPKIAPIDHQGVLVRVHDACGTLYDSTFLRFPLAEQRRLSQITCEIFVIEGFDGALNIDRESYNFAHPHAVALTKWLHSALRRVINTEKAIASHALEQRRLAGAQQAQGRAERVVEGIWERRSSSDGTRPPNVFFTETSGASGTGEAEGAYVFERGRVVGNLTGPNAAQRQAVLEDKLRKITQILAAFDLLDELSATDAAELIRGVRQILQAFDS